MDHVLFSNDYPFSDTGKGREFIREIEAEGLLTGNDLEAFVQGNAAKLLHLER